MDHPVNNPPPVYETELLTFRASGIHGNGAFAKVEVKQGTRLIEYVGEKIDKEESLRRCMADNPYIFSLDSQFDLDGDVMWNPARFINHSCAANCEAELDGGRLWICATRDISPGEEVTFNYGYDLVDYREYPCRCGAANCVGYMVAEEFFEHVRNRSGSV
jgi:uncharacterized protein